MFYLTYFFFFFIRRVHKRRRLQLAMLVVGIVSILYLSMACPCRSVIVIAVYRKIPGDLRVRTSAVCKTITGIIAVRALTYTTLLFCPQVVTIQIPTGTVKATQHILRIKKKKP